MEKIDELAIADETVVFITSDNGPLNSFSNVGLRGRKSHVWEGGHRVPGIFRWPRRIEAGSECAVAISGVDYLPTVCEIAGIETPADRVLDGISILPLLGGNGDTFHRQKPLYWFFYRLNLSLAVRDGDWILIANTNDAQRPKTHSLVRDDMPLIRSSKPVEFQLFNLNADPTQKRDLTSTNVEVLERLKAQAIQMHCEVVEEGFYWDLSEEYGAESKRKIWNSP